MTDEEHKQFLISEGYQIIEWNSFVKVINDKQGKMWIQQAILLI